MRLDKFIAGHLAISRASAGREIRAGKVTVNGEIVKDSAMRILASHQIRHNATALAQLSGWRYFMLNKPAGYVCSNDDPDHPTVFSLLQEPLAHKLHCAGRLDLDATGLLLLTDDGQWSHRITSPRHHCEKTYCVTLAAPLAPDTAAQFARGILLRNEQKPTKAAHLEPLSATLARVTISEGRYHQIKRMFAATGNHVQALHRERIGDITLDPALNPADYRPLTEQEIASIGG